MHQFYKSCVLVPQDASHSQEYKELSGTLHWFLQVFQFQHAASVSFCVYRYRLLRLIPSLLLFILLCYKTCRFSYQISVNVLLGKALNKDAANTNVKQCDRNDPILRTLDGGKRSITIHDVGEITKNPDIIKFTVSVCSSKDTIESVKTSVKRRIDYVLQTLRSYGIGEKSFEGSATKLKSRTQSLKS